VASHQDWQATRVGRQSLSTIDRPRYCHLVFDPWRTVALLWGLLQPRPSVISGHFPPSKALQLSSVSAHPPFSAEFDLNTINIEIPDNLTPLEWGSDEAFASELLLAAAIQWYSQGVISQGRTAEIAGLDRTEKKTGKGILTFLMKLPKAQVQRERRKLGIPGADRNWTEDDDSCLGADRERAVFKVLGRTAEAVSL
jgi:hypothetical protein